MTLHTTLLDLLLLSFLLLFEARTPFRKTQAGELREPGFNLGVWLFGIAPKAPEVILGKGPLSLGATAEVDPLTPPVPLGDVASAVAP